jgi:hypothetical protein
MTLQKRYLATPHDIRAIRLTCKCGTSLSFIPAEKTNFPDKCHNCHAPWFLENDLTQAVLDQVILGLGALRKRSEAVTCKIEFEFDQPE